jgi:hypothetical protein
VSRSEVERPLSRGDARRSARLGLTLRSILLSPTAGFSSALRIAERRSRAGRRPAEGWAPVVLTAIGGASLAFLWLKIGALIGLREVCADDRLASYLAATLVLGALLALIGYAVWGAAGPPVTRMLRGSGSPAGLRLVWGTALLPQVFALALLLPLDLAIVGMDTFTTSSLGDPLSTAWAAFSIALSVSLAVWSLFLLVRGIEVAAELSMVRAAAGAAAAAVCLLVVVGVLATLTLFAPGGGACPT